MGAHYTQSCTVCKMPRNEKFLVQLCIKHAQAGHIARIEHLSDAVVCLESFIGTPMETDSTFKAYNGTNSLF